MAREKIDDPIRFEDFADNSGHFKIREGQGPADCIQAATADFPDFRKPGAKKVFAFFKQG